MPRKVAAVHGLALTRGHQLLLAVTAAQPFGDTKIHFRDFQCPSCHFHQIRIYALQILFASAAEFKCVANSSFSFTLRLKAAITLSRAFSAPIKPIDAPINVTASSGNPKKRNDPATAMARTPHASDPVTV